MKGGGEGGDVRRLDRQQRYKPSAVTRSEDDLTYDFLTISSMMFGFIGLILKSKGCAWLAIYLSCAAFANSRTQDNAKCRLTNFLLSITCLVTAYIQNPLPMSPIWITSFT